MKGKFKIEIDPKTQNMMEALGIPQERCQELCGLVEQIHTEHPNYNLGQILQEVSIHCENQNEVTFMSYVLGTKVGFMEGIMANKVAQSVENLFEHLSRVHEREGSFNMS